MPFASLVYHRCVQFSYLTNFLAHGKACVDRQLPLTCRVLLAGLRFDVALLQMVCANGSAGGASGTRK